MLVKSVRLSTLSHTLLFVLLLLISSVSWSADLIDGIVAIVNDDVITISELRELVMPMKMRLQSVSDPLKRDELLKEQVEAGLEQLIGQRLLLQQAKEQGVEVSDEQIDGHLRSVMGQQGWNEQQLQQYLQAQGMSIEDLKAQSKDFLLQQAISQRTLLPKLKVGDADLQSAYRDFLTEARANYKVEGAHIVIPVSAGADATTEAAAKQQASELLTRLRRGETFTSLAQQYSKGPQAASGGDLGVISRGGGLPVQLEDAFFTLEQGEYSGPIRTDFGYHVITVTRKEAQPVPAFDNVKGQLEMKLRQDRFQGALEEWISKLKRDAFIERRPTAGIF